MSSVATDRCAWLAMALLVASSPLMAEDSASIRSHPKLFARTSYLLSTNTAKSSSSSSLGDLQFGGMWFFVPRLAAGLDYEANLNFLKKSVTSHGIDLFARFYFSETGTWVTAEDPQNGISRRYRSQWAPYAVGRLSQRSYSTFASATQEINGVSVNYDLGAGTDVAISNSLEINVEAIGTVFGFSTYPDVLQLRTYGLYLGVGYVF